MQKATQKSTRFSFSFPPPLSPNLAQSSGVDSVPSQPGPKPFPPPLQGPSIIPRLTRSRWPPTRASSRRRAPRCCLLPAIPPAFPTFRVNLRVSLGGLLPPGRSLLPSFAFKAASSELCPPPCYALLTPYTRTQTHPFERTHSVPLSQSEHSGRKPKVFLETFTWQGPAQPLPQSQRSASGGCWPGTLGPAALGGQASLTEPWTSRTSRLGRRSSPWLLARKPKCSPNLSFSGPGPYLWPSSQKHQQGDKTKGSALDRSTCLRWVIFP